MASSRVLLLLSVLVLCSQTEAKVCGGDADCLTNYASGTWRYVCRLNFKDCDHSMANGCESDILTDEFNCGGCARECPSPYNAKASCEEGKCAISDFDDDFFIPGQY